MSVLVDIHTFIVLQLVSFGGISRGHILLFQWNDVRSGGNIGTFQQNIDVISDTSNNKLSLLASPNIAHFTMSKTSATKI